MTVIYSNHLLLIPGSLYFYYSYMRDSIMARREAAIVQEEKIGTPKLGGPWTLFDKNGKMVCSEDLKGK
jgi:hypothetical protein